MNQLSNEARLSARLQELRGELGRGEAQMAELDQRRANLRDTLLRISGAIQVLQELLEQQPAPSGLFPDGAGTREASIPAEIGSPVPGVPD